MWTYVIFADQQANASITMNKYQLAVSFSRRLVSTLVETRYMERERV
jgi:hypothetical protein